MPKVFKERKHSCVKKFVWKTMLWEIKCMWFRSNLIFFVSRLFCVCSTVQLDWRENKNSPINPLSLAGKHRPKWLHYMNNFCVHWHCLSACLCHILPPHFFHHRVSIYCNIDTILILCMDFVCHLLLLADKFHQFNFHLFGTWCFFSHLLTFGIRYGSGMQPWSAHTKKASIWKKRWKKFK